MLFYTKNFTQVFDETFTTTLARMAPNDVCVLVQQYCLGIGGVYHRVNFNGTIGYVHCDHLDVVIPG